jgi:hypothetical protein
MKLFAIALTFLFLSGISQAKVLVFRGTIKLVNSAPPIDSLPKVINVYYFIDPDTNQVSSVSYFTKSGQKKQVKSPPTDLYITSAPARQGKIQTGLTYADRAVLTDADNFDAASLLLRGTNATLKFTTMGLSQTINFPALLQGSQQIISSSNGAGFIVVTNFLLSYQKVATIGVNDAAISIADQTDAVSQQLMDKGYLP